MATLRTGHLPKAIAYTHTNFARPRKLARSAVHHRVTIGIDRRSRPIASIKEAAQLKAAC